MKSVQEEIKKAAGDIGKELKNEQVANLQKSLQNATRGTKSPKDALGLTDAMVEGVYGQAYRLYNTGKYKDAIQLFKLLIMISPTTPKFIMGLAASFHLLKDYKMAADTYVFLGVIDAENPISFYHTSDCYVRMNDPVSAIVALNMAIKRCGDKPEFKVLKDRAILTLQSLKKNVEEGKVK